MKSEIWVHRGSKTSSTSKFNSTRNPLPTSSGCHEKRKRRKSKRMIDSATFILSLIPVNLQKETAGFRQGRDQSPCSSCAVSHGLKFEFGIYIVMANVRPMRAAVLAVNLTPRNNNLSAAGDSLRDQLTMMLAQRAAYVSSWRFSVTLFIMVLV